MENAARVAAVIPKRASASVVATPSDERCSTAITAANCPTVSTSHAVRPPRAGRGADRSEAGWLGVGLTTAPRYPPPLLTTAAAQPRCRCVSGGLASRTEQRGCWRMTCSATVDPRWCW